MPTNKRNAMKRISIALFLVIATITMTSCSLVTVKPVGEIETKAEVEIGDTDKTYAIPVTISDGNNISLYEAIYLPEGCDCGEYFRQLCNDNDIVIKGIDDGYVTEIDGVASEGDYAWMFFINGELSEVGIDDYVPVQDDSISLEYVNWTEIFE